MWAWFPRKAKALFVHLEQAFLRQPARRQLVADVVHGFFGERSVMNFWRRVRRKISPHFYVHHFLTVETDVPINTRTRRPGGLAERGSQGIFNGDVVVHR